jgi:hypothetical protein
VVRSGLKIDYTGSNPVPQKKRMMEELGVLEAEIGAVIGVIVIIFVLSLLIREK